MVTTNYGNSTAVESDVYSFYYGCSVNLEIPIDQLPPTCSITATDFGDSDMSTTGPKQFVAQTFEYVPTAAQQMSSTVHLSPLFRNLQYVVFTAEAKGEAAAHADIELYLDNFSIQVRGCQE